MTVAGGRTSACGLAALLVCCVLSLAWTARAELVVYPEYPAALERDFAYAVSVTQKGGETKPLVVYNHTERSALSERTRGGDVNRRFCEFAFSDEPVRVDIRVRRDVSSYKVFPARLALKHGFKDGVISVRVDRPVQFGVQLNDRDHTILSVFADPPETDVPAKDSPGVMYVEGWRDAPGRDGVVEIGPDVRDLYLAPGSVFNARLRVRGAGTKVHGRGVVLDPMSDIFRYDQTANAERGLFVVCAPKVSVEGIKFLDARTFNLMSFHPGVSFRNVKVLSSMMCSDGITCGSTGLTVENCWFHVGDNAVVLSGVTGARFRDVAIGTSCAAIFPQGSNRDVLFERTDVFRCDDGLINNRYNGVLRRNNKWSELGSGLQKKEPGPQDLPHQTGDIAFRDLAAVDCTLFPHFFSGRNMGVKPKRYAFTNLSIPKAAGKSHWRAAGRTDGCLFRVDNDPKRWLQTGNYSFAITNLVLGGEEVKSIPKGCVKGSDGEIRVAVAATENPDVFPRRADRTEVEWKSSERYLAAAQGAVTNLLAETSRTKSVWQRFPSWSVKLEATKRDEKGSVIYRLVQCERNAGMQAVVTDAFLGRGNGSWRLRCEARVSDGKPLTQTARLLSTETEYSRRAKLEPGGWQRLEIDFDTNFDLNVTELVALVLGTDRAVPELEFRAFAFVRDEVPLALPIPCGNK